MNITNEVRAKLVVAMLAHAVKKQSKPMQKTAKKLNDVLRALILEEAARIMPEMSQARITELIQQDVIKSFGGTVNAYGVDEAGKAAGPKDLGIVYLTFDKAEHTAWQRVHAAIEHHWGGFLNHVSTRLWDNQMKVTMRCSQADLPTVPGASRAVCPALVTDKTNPFSKGAWMVHEQSLAVNKLFIEVLNSAKAMHDDLWNILTNIRTVKQLEAQFPEALAFLPDYQPQVKRQQLADPNLISRARDMLVLGIPD